MRTFVRLLVSVFILSASVADGRPLHGGTAIPTTYPFVPTGYIAFGDSITEGNVLPSPTTQSYPALLYNNTYSVIPGSFTGPNANFQNIGTSGAFSCDNALEDNAHSPPGAFTQVSGFFYPSPSFTIPYFYTIAFGTNDANTFNAGVYETNFIQCTTASVSYLAIPDTAKITAQSCSQTGTWVTEPILPAPNWSVSSTTNGSTLTCSITTQGKPLFIWYMVFDGDAGTFTYAVDGGMAVSVNSFPANANTHSTKAMYVIRLTGISAATHSIVFTVTSSTSASNKVLFFGMGSPPSAAYADKMATMVSGVLRQENDTKAADTAAYNADAAGVVTQLAGDGMPVYFADVRSYLTTPTSTYMFDTLHPNATGEALMPAAYQAALP